MRRWRKYQRGRASNPPNCPEHLQAYRRSVKRSLLRASQTG